MLGRDTKKWEEVNGLTTATEIFQQPELWSETLEIIKLEKESINKFMKEKLVKENTRVIFTGAGTSAYAGDIVSAHLNENDNYSFEAIATTDLVSNPRTHFKKNVPTILVSFARSGNSPESVAAYELANQLVDDISHIFITCNDKGELAEISKGKDNILLLLMPEKSNDRGLAMTSSFSCMTLASLLIFDLENLEENSKQVAEMVTMGRDILDKQYAKLEGPLGFDYERVVYLGSGSFYGLTKESGLKLLELTRGQITSLNETPLGFRHGPKSILNDKTLVVSYISLDKHTQKYELDLLNEVYNDPGKHRVVTISKDYQEEIEKITDDYIYLTKDKNNMNNQGLTSLLYALFAQVFALQSSVKSNVEPDNPNPSGLINRVVQGVTIYDYCD